MKTMILFNCQELHMSEKLHPVKVISSFIFGDETFQTEAGSNKSLLSCLKNIFMLPLFIQSCISVPGISKAL